jgi:hypothetical protein
MELENFSTDFRKILKYQNSMKIRAVGTELFHSDRQTDGVTDMTKLTVAFRNFANAPKERDENALLLLLRTDSIRTTA